MIRIFRSGIFFKVDTISEWYLMYTVIGIHVKKTEHYMVAWKFLLLYFFNT